MADEHAFRFDKLIATVKRLSTSKDLYKVNLTGDDGTFMTTMWAENHATAANNVLDELLIAANHPRAFRVRRMHEIREGGLSEYEAGKMVETMEAALSYAEKHKGALLKAERALVEGRAKRLGSCES